MSFSARAGLALLLLSALSMSAKAQTPLPDAIAAPGETVVLTVHAEGAQVYECKAGADGKLAWAFREPIASLLVDGKTIGRHYAGPTWELHDGSSVVGEVVARDPGPDPAAIPWLLLKAKSTSGTGKLSRTQSILRVHTAGGVAPTSPCTEALAHTLVRVPYTATYYFYRAPH